jgi:manganese oxidase
VVKKITDLVPDYMAMSERGMHDMTEMEMPLPDNTAPMMTGTGPFGAIGMGGMFSVVKVRRDQKHGDYKDPGWFKHPAGTVAYEWTDTLAAPTRAAQPVAKGGVEVTVRKPTDHKH